MGGADAGHRFWLLSTGIHPVTRPEYVARVRVAMAAVRTIEVAGEIRWRGLAEDATWHAIDHWTTRSNSPPRVASAWRRLDAASYWLNGSRRPD